MSRLTGVQLHLVDSYEEVENFLRWLSADHNRRWLAVDVETEGFDWWRMRIRMAQFGDLRDGWAIPYDRWGGLIDEVFTRVGRNTRFVAHNKKFDQEFLLHHGHNPPPMDDTLPMVYLLEPHKAKGLKLAASRRIDPRAAYGQAELKLAMEKARWTWATIPWDYPAYWKYAALDTVLTAHLAEDCYDEVQEKYKLAYDLQVESDDVLLRMEMRGMKVDREYCEDRQDLLDMKLSLLLDWFRVEHKLDPLKPHDLVRFFWDQGIEIPLSTDKGAPSVKKESLEMIDHPLVSLILEARSYQKMSTTYFKNLLEYSDADGILHPTINPLGAITGRQSITRPALQTLPRTKLVRDAFIPRKKHKLVLADFQGQEMRVFAAYCGDPGMREAYARGEDLHNFTAEAVYGKDFTKAQRQVAKNAGFSKIYGAGLAKFAKTAGTTEPEARAFLERYDQLFSRVKPFQLQMAATIVQRARAADSDYGYVTTLAGRRVSVPLKKAYVGVNYTIQGGCSDILRQALVDLDRAGIADEGLVLPVHDETAFDVDEGIAEDLAIEAARVMEHSAEKLGLAVPMVVETEIVDRWGEKYAA